MGSAPCVYTEICVDRNSLTQPGWHQSRRSVHRNDNETLPIKATRVLILDDDRPSATAIGCCLEFRGHEVAVTSSIDEALAAAEKLIPETYL